MTTTPLAAKPCQHSGQAQPAPSGSHPRGGPDTLAELLASMAAARDRARRLSDDYLHAHSDEAVDQLAAAIQCRIHEAIADTLDGILDPHRRPPGV